MSLPELLAVFLRAAFFSVNGGTTLALLEEDLVRRLGVLSPEQFATGVAIGSASPGPFGFGCIALGFLAAGWTGAVVAALTSWLPAFLAVPVRAVYRKLEERPWVDGVRWGVAAAGAGLLLSMLVALGATSVTGIREGAVLVAAAALLWRGVPAPAVLVLAAAAGAVWLRPG